MSNLSLTISHGTAGGAIITLGPDDGDPLAVWTARNRWQAARAANVFLRNATRRRFWRWWL